MLAAMPDVFVVHFSGGHESGHCAVGAKDLEQARRVFRIRMGDEWTIDRVLTYEGFVAEERVTNPEFAGLEPKQIPALQKVIVLEHGT
jgi:hypothetical protein